MKVKCAIFDFDGTLFNSMSIWDSVGEIYLRSVKKVPKPSMREDVRALSLYQSACYFKQEYNLSFSIEKIMTDINRTIEHFYIREILPKPGVIDFLKQMKKAEIPMCITSASARYLIEAALNRCEMKHYFEDIFTCDEVGHGKDEPFIFQKAMAHFGADRSSAIVFEDALYAIRTAKADGFTVVAVFDESEKRQSEISEIVDFRIANFEHTEKFWKFVSAE